MVVVQKKYIRLCGSRKVPLNGGIHQPLMLSILDTWTGAIGGVVVLILWVIVYNATLCAYSFIACESGPHNGSHERCGNMFVHTNDISGPANSIRLKIKWEQWIVHLGGDVPRKAIGTSFCVCMPNVNSNVLFLSATLRIAHRPAREHSPIKCVRDE